MEFEPSAEILKCSPIPYYHCDINGKIISYNDAAKNVWGREPNLADDLWSGALKEYYYDGTPVQKAEHPAAQILQKSAFDTRTELRVEQPNGSLKYILLVAQPSFNKSDLVGGYFYMLDFTEFRVNNIKNASLSTIIETSDDAIITKDLQGKITSWNQAAERIFGYSEKEAIGKPITMLFPNSRLHEEDVIISQLKSGQRIDHFETIRLNKDGKPIAIELNISPIKNVHGKVIGASKVARDISEHISSHEKKEILSAIVESSDDAIISKNLDSIIISWNKGAQKIFGYTEQEAIGNSITMLIPENKLSEEVEILSKIRKGEKIDHFETVRKHKSGRDITVSITVSPLKNHKGEIVGASKVARDITQQVEYQKALEKYNRNLEILNSIGKSISEKNDFKEVLQWIVDTTYRLTNSQLVMFFYEVKSRHKVHSYAAVSGRSKHFLEDIGVSRFKDIVPKSNAQSLIFNLNDEVEILNKRKSIYEKLHSLLGSSNFMVLPLSSEHHAAGGGFIFCSNQPDYYRSQDLLLIRNIASQVSATLQNSYLFEKIKQLNAKKDEFIAVASHELKTPLTSLKGYLQLLQHTNQNPATDGFIDKSLTQVERLNGLVDDLLNMSRLDSGRLDFKKRIFDLNKVIIDVVANFKYTHPSHEILFDVQQELLVFGDAQRIEQVIINLISNAIKYSPFSNTIEITATKSVDSIIVSVRDYGIGVKEEHQKFLFDRFYRAENSTGIGGLGIGLYLSKEIIKRHKGEIGYRKPPGSGSEFYFTLPYVDDFKETNNDITKLN
ncbi:MULTISPECIES: PAS domain-containing sensor histidine kinase [Christiangramia]|uniref:histidine kinase n=1 Tax=Christiangramia flava JLT2011 TaxID=1229726 RepID=A0A1L7I306_9FLAO|nr:PAS domain S-box protein [Christiangramia flava]APU67594.1 Response sensor protein [Christiangramia flava JLT2011]